MARPILRPASAACSLMRSLFGVTLVAVVAVFLASSTALTATISSSVDDHGNHFLTLDGPIGAGDPDRLAAAILAANDHGYRLDALRLNSSGGLIWEAMVMAVMVRWVKNMATVVRRDAKCESACFGVFAAGHRKYVDRSPIPHRSACNRLTRRPNNGEAQARPVINMGARPFFGKKQGIQPSGL